MKTRSFPVRISLVCLNCVLAVGLPLAVLLPRPAFAQEQMLRTLTVTGVGEVDIPTSLSEVRLGVEVQAQTAEAAQQEAARRSSSLVAFLQSRNVDELQTTGVNLYPRYSYETGQEMVVGYTASNAVSFQLPTEEVGDLLDRSVEAGATRIEGVSFMATEEAIADAQQDALREATSMAQDQADVVLSTLGLTRRDVVSIQINGAYAPAPMPMFYEAAQFADRSATTPVLGGDQTIQASVTLQIRY